MCLCPLTTVAKNAENFLELYGKQCLQTRNDHCMGSVQVWSFMWSIFSRIQTEYGNLLSKYPCLLERGWQYRSEKLRIWTLFTQRILPLLLLAVNQFLQKLMKRKFLKFAKLLAMRVMHASVVYVSTCQKRANFSFLSFLCANVPSTLYTNVSKSVSIFQLCLPKAYQFFNYFSKEFFNFWIFQLQLTFVNFKNI